MNILDGMFFILIKTDFYFYTDAPFIRSFCLVDVFCCYFCLQISAATFTGSRRVELRANRQTYPLLLSQEHLPVHVGVI